MVKKILIDNRFQNYISKDFREYLLQLETLTFLKKGKVINDEEYEKVKVNIKYEN